jgi:hypothetical protein
MVLRQFLIATKISKKDYRKSVFGTATFLIPVARIGQRIDLPIAVDYIIPK